MPDPSCSNCRFGIYIEQAASINAFVVCRRFPPYAAAYNFDGGGRTGDSREGFWPEVGPDDECGEHKFAD